MNYYFDTEFIEGFHKPIGGKRRHFIDLISIGIVCEDGRTYEAISREYRYNDADKWVKENVIQPIWDGVIFPAKEWHTVEDFHWHVGKSNKTIANEIMRFMNDPNDVLYNKWEGSEKKYYQHLRENYAGEKHTIIAYYADYDWVLLCSLFGRMIDLPAGFPMYCRDIKQMMDEIGIPKEDIMENIPANKSPHNALDDAQWNKNAYEFIKSIEYHI